MIKKEKKKISLEGLDKRLGGVDKRLEGVDERLERVDKKLEGMDERLKRVEISQRKTGVQLDRLEGKFDLCIEGFSSLKERTDKIEERVGVLEGKI